MLNALRTTALTALMSTAASTSQATQRPTNSLMPVDQPGECEQGRHAVSRDLECRLERQRAAFEAPPILDFGPARTDACLR